VSRRRTFRIARLGAVSLLAAVAAGAASAGQRSSTPEAPALARVVTGLPGAVFAAAAPSGFPGRLYVVQRTGLVRIVDRGRVLDTAFLDIRGRVATGGLRGLYSLAFDPHYARNGRFYVNYVGRDGDVYVSRFTAVHGVGARSSGRVLLHVPAPQKAAYGHYGGEVAFGPDGRLYVGFGDDGRAEAAQDPATLLGKLVRLDVDVTHPEPETVAVGLRNPWRLSFDRVTGDLYIGDVGENRREEVDRLPRRFRGVANFGWPYWEGLLRVRPAPAGLAGRLVEPFAEYHHARGRCNAITGGYV